MKITEVRVKLLFSNDGDEKLRGFCSITFDNEFVIRDIKIIEGAKGLFVAMPSRRVTSRCSKCGDKNHLRARFCNDCGASLKVLRKQPQDREATRLFVDIAHPINQDTRQTIHEEIMKAFQEEMARADERTRSSGEDQPPGAQEPRQWEAEY